MEDPQAQRAAITRQIEDSVNRIMHSRAEVIEKACEMALAAGMGGVAVYDDGAVVDPSVPYGQIHYHHGAFQSATQRDSEGRNGHMG